MKTYFRFLYFLGLIFFSLHISVLAQERPKRFPSITRNIEDMYRYVSEKVKQNQYYVNEWSYNHFRQPNSDKTIKYGTECYYYSFLGENEPILRLITVQILREQVLYYYEFLFTQEGHLCLVLERQKDEKNISYRNMKIFFDKRKCINLFLDKDIIPHTNTGYNEKVGILQKLGEEYYQKFLLQLPDIGY